ncbi:hypothetical protein QYE76_035422 [Lolium multiflorum]|uniref:Uncharacterized protein n=1 Tax=Lolium multiflorum TaxID=4521 RepID=A0AAD8VM63_LOLMU|nr:hypothetical protein QYE76_035422 [Lolium multiflorum]
MSRVSLHDSINPKPQSEGIAEEYPRQLVPSVGRLSAQDLTSAVPIMSSTASSTPSSPSSPRLGSPIQFGSYEFTPHSDSSRSTFSDLQGNMEMTFGSVHYNINAEGVLRLLGPHAPSQYSSGEDNVDSIAKKATWKAARHQVYAANNAGNTRNRGDGDHTPLSSRRISFENSASNNNSDYTIAEEEWAAARAAMLNNTSLPAGTSVGTLNAYRSILEKNRERLSKEQATLERRLSAAEQSSERRRGSRGSASRSSQGIGKHRSRLSRLSEDDAREITSNLTKSFMTTDTAGMLRPKTVEGATAILTAYLIN